MASFYSRKMQMGAYNGHSMFYDMRFILGQAIYVCDFDKPTSPLPTDDNPCYPTNDCLNGGTCIPTDTTTYTCKCRDQFIGEFCAEESCVRSVQDINNVKLHIQPKFAQVALGNSGDLIDSSVHEY